MTNPKKIDPEPREEWEVDWTPRHTEKKEPSEAAASIPEQPIFQYQLGQEKLLLRYRDREWEFTLSNFQSCYEAREQVYRIMTFLSSDAKKLSDDPETEAARSLVTTIETKIEELRKKNAPDSLGGAGPPP